MASDSPDQNLTQYFSLCNDFIHAARLREGNVLIHCLAGMSRSVTVTVAYIMSVTNLNWKEALKVVRAGRAVANPNLGFQKQLQDFEATRLVKFLITLNLPASDAENGQPQTQGETSISSSTKQSQHQTANFRIRKTTEVQRF
ncbi:hypothetical protein GEV33_001195 [Tenebrio molitor]|nr:hypothetical protein GEV33_001195 [Tenebrio molitor]